MYNLAMEMLVLLNGILLLLLAVFVGLAISSKKWRIVILIVLMLILSVILLRGLGYVRW